MIGGSDLKITSPSGETHGYVIATSEQNPVVHTKTAPNVPLPGSSTSPTQSGGVYDVRDSDGDKAISYFDWSLGSGQKSADSPAADPSMFWESSCVNISTAGQVSLLNAVAATAAANTSGPVYSACGVLWMGQDAGALKYSVDNGVTWSSATVTSTTINASIDDFCTDGAKVYFCVSGSDNAGGRGIWANTAGSPYVFTKYGSVGTTSAVKKIAYQSGIIFAATASNVSMVADNTGILITNSTQMTPYFMNKTMTTVGLVSAANAVYWVVSQGDHSYVYLLTVDCTSTTMTTEQQMETPSGFVATCAVGYLSTVYVGGYWQSSHAGVGRGSVYETSSSIAAPLFSIGELPETTPIPGLPSNDNRIVAMFAGAKDLYVLTSRACYRWDIDGSGYSHVFDHKGAGFTVNQLIWNTSSLLSWDGVDLGAPFHPSGWTVTPADYDTDWVFSGTAPAVTSAKYNGTTSQVWTAVPPTAGNADTLLSNALGTSLEFTIPADQEGDILVSLKDGTREARLRIGPTIVYLYQYGVTTIQVTTWTSRQVWHDPVGNPLSKDGSYHPGYWGTQYFYVTTNEDTTNYLWSDETPASGETIKNPTLTIGCPVEKKVLFKLQRTTATVSFDSGTTAPGTVATKADASANRIQLTWNQGSSIDSIVVNTAGSSTISGSSVFRPSITRHNGVMAMPYRDPSTTPVTVGRLLSASSYATTGYVTQAHTNFHSGSVLKDLRAIVVDHDLLPAGCAISASWDIDGVVGAGSGIPTGTSTTIPIDSRGCGISVTTILAGGTSTPLVKSANVIWDFVKTKKHQYLLQCVSNANGGRWDEDPQEAIAFLFATADQQATFEDRFAGTYAGTITDVQFSQANRSQQTGYEGLVRITVRES